MISFIKGTIVSINDGNVIIENNGMGYCVNMPSNALYQVCEGDKDVKIYTYMVVKEDDISLYGFLTLPELNMFKMLISVNGIGPKGAVGILSSISIDELRTAIVMEDHKLIAGAKGIGSKTAQKIVIELKGKFEADKLQHAGSQSAAGTIQKASSTFSEAIDALEALGFTRSSALNALNRLENTENMTVSELIGNALSIIE